MDLTRAEVRRGGTGGRSDAARVQAAGRVCEEPGTCSAATALIDQAWGRDMYVTERAVDNQIVNLRRKLDPVHIVSVRGSATASMGEPSP